MIFLPFVEDLRRYGFLPLDTVKISGKFLFQIINNSMSQCLVRPAVMGCAPHIWELDPTFVRNFS